MCIDFEKSFSSVRPSLKIDFKELLKKTKFFKANYDASVLFRKQLTHGLDNEEEETKDIIIS